MPSISQTIPNYILGISEQPDQLKLPGQVTDLNNGYPDVTSGLVKRPGTKLLSTATNAADGGKWFDIYRDQYEQYMCQVTTTGQIKVWRLVDYSTLFTLSVADGGGGLPQGSFTNVAVTGGSGTGMTVDYTVDATGVVQTVSLNTPGSGYEKNDSLSLAAYESVTFNVDLDNEAGEEVEVTYEGGGTSMPYLVHTDPDDIQALTVNDFTFLTNRSKVTAMAATTSATQPNQAFIDILQVAYNKTYTFRLLDDEGTEIAVINSTKTAKTVDQGEVKVSTILSQLKSAVDGTTYENTNFSAEIIGNGLYITHDEPFAVDTPEAQLINVFTGEIEIVGRLPYQCKQGYVAKIVNSSADLDDYYVEFQGHNGVDGEGVWVETIRPGTRTSVDATTMPYQLVRQADSTFHVSPVDWAERDIGDEQSCPRASFLPKYEEDGSEGTGKKINKLLFFRNRLCILSDENIVMSRPGEFFNFWSKTAFTTTGVDPIDLSCSSTTPAVLYDGIEVNTGLILFSRTQQFMLVTDADTLTADTAKINVLSQYNYDENTRPINIGTTIAFINDSGTHSRLFEMTRIAREGEPEVLEQSKIISTKFPTGLGAIADSRENSLVLFGSKELSKELWGYKYFNRGDQRIQSAWFRWTMSGEVVHQCILKDNIFFVIRNQNPGSDPATYTYTLHRLNLQERDKNVEIEGGEREIRIFLDHRVTVAAADITYDTSTRRSTFATPIPAFGTYVVYTLEDGNNTGNAVYPTVDGSNLVVDGDWSDTSLTVGFEYEMSIQLPNIYYQQQVDQSFRADVHASLVIHRVKLDFGPVGVFKTTLKRKGRADFTTTYNVVTLGQYELGDLQVVDTKQMSIPIYDRNTNCTLQLISEHPSPASLYGMSWEGDFSKRFYERV